MSNTCKADHMHNMSLFVACADEMSHAGNSMAKKTHSKKSTHVIHRMVKLDSLNKTVSTTVAPSGQDKHSHLPALSVF